MISQNPVLAEINKELEVNGGVLGDMWVMYEGERWHPVKVRDRVSGKHGFDVNFSGKWGKKAEVGRKKLTFDELIEALVGNEIPNGAMIRCKRVNDSQKNGRKTADLQFSPRLSKLISESTRLKARADEPK